MISQLLLKSSKKNYLLKTGSEELDSSHFNNHARVDSDSSSDSKFYENRDKAPTTRGSSLKNQNHRVEASSVRPTEDFYQNTDQPNNEDSSNHKSPYYVDKNDDKNDEQTYDETYDVSDDKKISDRLDNDEDATYVDDAETNDVIDDKKSDKNETTKQEFDYIYYYYYDYVYPDEEGLPEKKIKKAPKGLETLPNPSYLTGSETTETTLGDELSTVFPTTSYEFEEESS
jgi:hypothetical protein